MSSSPARVALFVLVAGVGALALALAAVASTTDPTDVFASSVGPGTCFEMPEERAYWKVTIVDCDEPHEAEMMPISEVGTEDDVRTPCRAMLARAVALTDDPVPADASVMFLSSGSTIRCAAYSESRGLVGSLFD